MRFGFAIATLACLGCGAGPPASPKPTKWTKGFWFWQGSYASVSSRAEPLDVLFVQQGGGVPKDLPPVREAWHVFRFDERSAPTMKALPRLVESIGQFPRIQLDIDCPTLSLREYAAFLRELRKVLAPGTQISITALLDWFRDGTSIGDVLAEVDEFVPQFYDVQDRTVIAARFTAAKWGTHPQSLPEAVPYWHFHVRTRADRAGRHDDHRRHQAARFWSQSRVHVAKLPQRCGRTPAPL
jgi:hypothetical protein